MERNSANEQTTVHDLCNARCHNSFEEQSSKAGAPVDEVGEH